jgi:Na+-transporting NADH:ubiquinone oxidoreductase subunit C
MNTNSNSYTIIYASVMVVIVAFLLAFVNSSLRDLQGKNVELDTKKQILSSLGIKGVQDAEAEFAKVVKSDMVVAEDGTNQETIYKLTVFCT